MCMYLMLLKYIQYLNDLNKFCDMFITEVRRDGDTGIEPRAFTLSNIPSNFLFSILKQDLLNYSDRVWTYNRFDSASQTVRIADKRHHAQLRRHV